MNFAASGPTTSILPSVEASNRPAALRTVTHSRLTAACMSSPALREIPGALPLADILEHRAVRLRPGMDRRCGASDRTAARAHGRRSRRRSPAYRARGRWSARPRGISLPSVSAAIARPCMLDVLPWSVAMPLVVKRLTCSIERMPSRTARRMSLAVTSFWKSTKALTVVSGAGARRRAQHAAGPAFAGVDLRLGAPWPLCRPPPSPPSRRPHRPRRSIAARPSVPLQAPTETQSCA